MFEVEHEWLTQEQIAAGCNLSRGATRKALAGEAVRPATVRKLAVALRRRVREIAVPVESL